MTVAPPDVQGFLPIARAMGEHRRVVIEQHNLTLVQFRADEPDHIMQASPQRHEVPAEMRAEEDATVDTARSATIRPPPDLIHQRLVRPGQVFPGQPPTDCAIALLPLPCLVERSGRLSRL